MSGHQQRLQRQVQTLLSSLEEALEGEGHEGLPSTRPPASAAALAPAILPALPGAPAVASPFSMSSGGLFSATKQPPQSAGPATLSLTQLEAQLATSDREAPPCRPYEVADFLARVGTFRAGASWFDKPFAVSPPECARFGWTLDGLDLLTCRVCGACVKAPADRETAANLVEQLSSAHAELCPWRKNASPPTIGAMLLPGHLGAPPSLPHGVSIGAEAMRLRSASLLALPVLPQLAPATDSAWVACAAACAFEERSAWEEAVLRLAGLERPSSTLSASERQRRWVAAALAMLGWRGGAQPNTLECAEDARTVGMWSYAPLDGTSAQPRLPGAPAHMPQSSFGLTGTAAAAAPSAALLVAAPSAADSAVNAPSGECFDPIAEHRSWSPWLVVTDGDSVPAWMRCTALLLPPSAPGRHETARPTATSLSATVSGVLAAVF